MDNQYFWKINEKVEKERLFRIAEKHFRNSNKAKLLSQSLGVDQKTIYRHKKGETDALHLKTAGRLINLLNKSEPRFNLEQPKQYEKDQYTYGSEDKISLNQDFQRFLLAPFSKKEIANRSNKSKGSAEKYKQGKRNPSESFYKEILADQTEIMYSEISEITGDIHLHNPSLNENEPSIKNADIEQVQEFREGLREINRLDAENKRAKGLLASNMGVIGELINVIEDENQSGIYLTGYAKASGALEEMNIVESWGGNNSDYFNIKEESVPYLKAIRAELNSHEFY